MSLFTNCSNSFAFQSTNYTTLGPKFYTKLPLATKMLLLFCKSMIPVRFCTVLPLHSCASIKTRFKALLKTQYLTLGPNFDVFIVLPPKCYFCFVNPWFRCGSAAFYLYIPVPVSKHDWKHFSKHNTLLVHWDRNSNFSLFCHQNLIFVL